MMVYFKKYKDTNIGSWYVLANKKRLKVLFKNYFSKLYSSDPKPRINRNIVFKKSSPKV